MFRIIAAASLSAFTLAGASVAQETSFDIGVGYDRVDNGNEFNAVTVRTSFHFNEHFAVEGQASAGLSGYSVGTVDIDLNHSLGIFGVARAPMNSGSSAFLFRVGYTTNEVEASAGPISITDTDQAWALGAGFEHFFSDRHGLRFDVTRLEFSDGDDTFAAGISYVYRIGQP